MKRLFLMVLTLTMSASFAFAQSVRSTHSTSANNESSTSAKGRHVNLASNTSLAAQLENSLDARRAKVGDRVVLKTSEALSQNGEIVVPKGARLLGHITEVQQRTKENGESRIGIAFDRLQKGTLDMPITATIISITQKQSRATAGGSSLDSDMTSSGRLTSSGGQRSGGGVLDGVGNTVGGVVNTTTSTVNNVQGTTANAAGTTIGANSSTAGNLTGFLRGLQIADSSNAEADGGVTLSLRSSNLHLESGTTFHLLVSSAASAGTPR
jgi:hypothetical protein